MSRQLTISGLFSTLALVMLALFARAGEMPDTPRIAAQMIEVEAATSRSF